MARDLVFLLFISLTLLRLLMHFYCKEVSKDEFLKIEQVTFLENISLKEQITLLLNWKWTGILSGNDLSERYVTLNILIWARYGDTI